MSELPILTEGRLAPDAGARLFGAMLYPSDPRSARQFGAMLWEETEAKARGRGYVEGQLFKAELTRHNLLRLGLVGHMALRVARDHIEGREVSKSRASHVEAERFSITRTPGGKAMPTDRDRLRREFGRVAPAAHLWGASAVSMRDRDGSRREGVDLLSAIVVSREHLLAFLASALCLEGLLSAALPDVSLLAVPREALDGVDLSPFRLRLNDADPRVADAEVSYRSRSGT